MKLCYLVINALKASKCSQTFKKNMIKILHMTKITRTFSHSFHVVIIYFLPKVYKTINDKSPS